MTPEDYAILRGLIAQATWTKSKTYEKPFDHEYVILKNYPHLCAMLKQAIAEDGYDKSFMGQPYRYLDLDGYRYWHYQIVYNRDLASKVLPE